MHILLRRNGGLRNRFGDVAFRSRGTRAGDNNDGDVAFRSRGTRAGDYNDGDVAFRRRGTRAGDYNDGDVAQLARALDWQSRGRRFEPDLLHV